jgi:drug/metabolite transporter (DMT)-like permease
MHFRGILALLTVTLVWGTTFPAMKDLSSDFSAVWIVFIRFAMASVLLAPFLFRARLRDCMAGAMLGAALMVLGMIVSQWTPRPRAGEAAQALPSV